MKSLVINAKDFQDGKIGTDRVREAEVADSLLWRTRDEFLEIYWRGTLRDRVLSHLVDSSFRAIGGDTTWVVLDVTRDAPGGPKTTREVYELDSRAATLWVASKPKTIIEKANRTEPAKTFKHRNVTYQHLGVMDLFVQTRNKSFMVKKQEEKS